MRRAGAVLFALSLWIGAPALAGDAPRATQDRAAAAFDAFARDFMARIHGQEAREKRRPRVAAGPASSVFTYRGYGEEFRTELRPTGHAAAPFVGLLHYTENLYSCRDLEGGPCSVASSVPVTEVFRFRGGRWTY